MNFFSHLTKNPEAECPTLVEGFHDIIRESFFRVDSFIFRVVLSSSCLQNNCQIYSAVKSALQAEKSKKKQRGDVCIKKTEFS